MSKGMDRKKDSKKKPAKTLLEKRAVKKERKKASQLFRGGPPRERATGAGREATVGLGCFLRGTSFRRCRNGQTAGA